MAKKPQLKPKDTTSVSCTECDNATLMQWGDDPIIADCSGHHCREVASHRRSCPQYEPAKHLPKPIKHLQKFAGLQNKKNKG